IKRTKGYSLILDFIAEAKATFDANIDNPAIRAVFDSHRLGSLTSDTNRDMENDMVESMYMRKRRRMTVQDEAELEQMMQETFLGILRRASDFAGALHAVLPQSPFLELKERFDRELAGNPR